MEEAQQPPRSRLAPIIEDLNAIRVVLGHIESMLMRDEWRKNEEKQARQARRWWCCTQ